MNEHIDLTFVSAKIATRENEAANTIVHGLSAFYNIGQMARYRALYCQEQNAYLNGGSFVSASLIGQHRREAYKHMVLAGYSGAGGEGGVWAEISVALYIMVG